MTDSNNEINIKTLIGVLWASKNVIACITLFFAVLSVIISLMIPNMYISKAILAPVQAEDSLTSGLGKYSRLASLSGVNLPDGATQKTLEAIERIKSFEFFSNYIIPNVKLENIMAVNKWEPKENSITYKDEIYNYENKQWVRNVKFPKRPKPSTQEAFEEFKKIFSVAQDKNQFVIITVKHKSPEVAKNWLDIIIYNINESMREIDKYNAENSINYLNDISKTINVQSLKEVTANLLEEQMETLMLAASNKSYVFKTIESPIVSEKKISPNRPLICIMVTLLGALFSILAVLVSFRFNELNEVYAQDSH